MKMGQQFNCCLSSLGGKKVLVIRGEIRAEQAEGIDEKVQDDSGPERIRAVIYICQQTAQNKGWNEHNQIQMCYGKDRGAENHRCRPPVPGAESLKEKPSKEY